jgi:hypothetical protein
MLCSRRNSNELYVCQFCRRSLALRFNAIYMNYEWNVMYHIQVQHSRSPWMTERVSPLRATGVAWVQGPARPKIKLACSVSLRPGHVTSTAIV